MPIEHEGIAVAKFYCQMLIPLFSSHWATWLGMRGSEHTRLHGENRWRRRGFFRPKAGSKAVAMDCADRVLSKVKYKKLTRKSPLEPYGLA